MTILNFFIMSGTLMGSYLNSVLVNHLSFFQIYAVSFVSILVASIYVIFFVKETVTVAQEDKRGGIVRTFYNYFFKYTIYFTFSR